MNFIQKYMKYAEPQTGAPRIFHYYMGYALLAQVVNRRATYGGAGGAKGCNLWFILIGPSSLAFKSTVYRIGVDILKEVFRDAPHNIMLPSSGSVEAFVERLAEDPFGIIAREEFAALMEWADRSYNSGLFQLLTEIYDFNGSYHHRVGTRDKKKDYAITDPFVNIVCCSTIDWLGEKLNENRINGGFLHRFNLIHAPSCPKPPAITPPRDEALRQELVWELERIKGLSLGAMDYTPEARAKFVDWFDNWIWPRQQKATSMSTSNMQRRVTDCHKFAMLNAILRGETKHIDIQDVTDAISISSNIIQSACNILDHRLALNTFDQKKVKLMDLIQKFSKEGRTLKSDVMKHMRLGKREYDDMESSLEESGVIEISKEKPDGVGRPPTYYKAIREI